MNLDSDIQRAHEDPTPAPEPTTSSPNTTETSDKNDRQNNDPKSNSKNDRQSTATTKSGNPHQCIARSDGVVRALRARTGHQHRIAFMIVYGGL